MTKKGTKSACADFGLIALSYNLKRLHINLGWKPKNIPKHLKIGLKNLYKALERMKIHASVNIFYVKEINPISIASYKMNKIVYL